MRLLAAPLQAHLDANLLTLAHIVKITRRDGTIKRVTDHDANLVVPDDGSPPANQTYSARSCTVGNITFESGQGAPSADIDILVGGPSPVTEADVIAGFYEAATIELWKVNWADTTQSEKLFLGFIGDIVFDNAGAYQFDIQGVWAKASTLKLRTYKPTCSWELGDADCGMPIRPDDVLRNEPYEVGDFVRFSSDSTTAGYGNRNFECTTAGTTAGTAPTYDYTVGNTTTDGTAVFTAREAWTRYATVASVVNAYRITITVTEPRAVDNWFTRGAGKWFSGDNNGWAFGIRKWTQAGSILELWQPQKATVQIGDEMEIHVGDDLTRATCQGRFDNLIRFGGFPHVRDKKFGG